MAVPPTEVPTLRILPRLNVSTSCSLSLHIYFDTPQSAFTVQLMDSLYTHSGMPIIFRVIFPLTAGTSHNQPPHHHSSAGLFGRAEAGQIGGRGGRCVFSDISIPNISVSEGVQGPSGGRCDISIEPEKTDCHRSIQLFPSLSLYHAHFANGIYTRNSIPRASFIGVLFLLLW